MTTGRRKRAVARVTLKAGSGQMTINGRSLKEYFPRIALQVAIQEPLEATQTADKFDCVARIAGGGLAGQAGALRHGLARALCQADETFRPLLRQSGFLTRDPRKRERKKYGQKGARKRFQWTKR